jgi:hypothetical protein
MLVTEVDAPLDASVSTLVADVADVDAWPVVVRPSDEHATAANVDATANSASRYG